ncbi:hypothetical protein MRX96_017974 [Rhipicephalus microplus]
MKNARTAEVVAFSVILAEALYIIPACGRGELLAREKKGEEENQAGKKTALSQPEYPSKRRLRWGQSVHRSCSNRPNEAPHESTERLPHSLMNGRNKGTPPGLHLTLGSFLAGCALQHPSDDCPEPPFTGDRCLCTGRADPDWNVY